MHTAPPAPDEPRSVSLPAQWSAADLRELLQTRAEPRELSRMS